MGMNGLKTYAMMRSGDSDRDSGRDGRIDNRFRDSKGREHYDNGRFAPMRSEYGRDGMYDYIPTPMSGGTDYRYTPTRSNYDRPSMGYVEPIRMGGDDEDHEGRRSWRIIENNGDAYMEPRYETEYNRDGMRRVVGFGGSSYVEHPRMDEMSHRSGEKMPGYASTKGMPRMTREMADEWMENLQNEDGTRGPHWSLEQVKELMNKKGIECDPVRLWVAMNAEYSDSVMINRKHGVDNAEFYLDSAIARWLQDKDAVKDKEAAYFMFVVKH